MNILRLLWEKSPRSLWFVALTSGLSGVAGGAVLSVIVQASEVEGVEVTDTDGAEHRLIFLFLVALAMLVYGKRVSILRSTLFMETVLTELRIRICDKLRKCELLTVERLDRSEIFTTISRDTGMLSQVVYMLAISCQQAVLLIAGLFYLAILSKAAFVLFLLVSGIAGYIYIQHAGDIKRTATKDRMKQAELLSYLSHILYGFKEIQLSRSKSDEVFDELNTVANETKELAVESSNIYVRGALITDISFYLLLGTIVFVLPNFSPTYTEVLVKSTIAVMFVFGPLSFVVGIVPQISNAEVALGRLQALEKDLDEGLREAPAEVSTAGSMFHEFQTIHCEELMYSYLDSDNAPTFTVGPASLDIRRAEILFVVGGNGSGKSTLLKLITGLYRPMSGNLRLDDTIITPANLLAYRELFAGVFSDFYLFQRLYGVDVIDADRAQVLLEKMEIDHKVQIVDGRFSTLDLSTGQRKRLALIASLLEDRHIYVFDEWTADQDPHFREQFYGTILPELKAQGKTIIAVTHDDRYWGAADRVLTLDFGKASMAEVDSGE